MTLPRNSSSIQYTRFISFLIIAIGILFVPFIASFYNEGVNWTLSDYIVAAVLLFGLSALVEFLLRRIQSFSFRIIALSIVLFIFCIIWLELAVGILNS